MAELEISDELVDSVMKAVAQFDERATDPGIMAQYLAAVMGYLLAKQDFSKDQKQQYLQQLFGFAHHVMEDNAPPEEAEAFGVWKPDVD